MISQVFTIPKERYKELRNYVRQEMPTFRFISNPIELRDRILISATYDVSDAEKLDKLKNKWEDAELEKAIKENFKEYDEVYRKLS